MRPPNERLIGRGGELSTLQGMLMELEQGRPGAIGIAGEAGIGKTRLLQELGALADERGYLVLAGSAAELEQDLPFAVFVEALDGYVGGLGAKLLASLDAQVQSELAQIFPSLWALGGGQEVAPQHERYRSHRAVRALLDLLGVRRPLVLLLDDLHWADPASIELLAALLRRPPAGPVAMALAHRQLPNGHSLGAAIERAQRAGQVEGMELLPLTFLEAQELLGSDLGPGDAAALYEESGGNPLYLAQLARWHKRAGRTPAATEPLLPRLGVPPAVVASLNEELAGLSDEVRQVFEGAAVAGDPFDVELAAAAAQIPEVVIMEALDELLQLELIRPTDAPRRFRFRHPLVRRAAYERVTGSWRIAAHERCADALAARGASAAVRAPHVERSARQGDLDAVAILREAGDAAVRLAPESAARWFSTALRLLPQVSPAEERIGLLLAESDALAASGHFDRSRETLLEALALAPDQSSALCTTIATSCAGIERYLGRYQQAHGRLMTAYRCLDQTVSADAVGLLIELTLNEFYRSRYDAMAEWADRAVRTALKLPDRTLVATAMAMPALAAAVTGRVEAARSHRADAAAIVDQLSDDELSGRLDALAWLAASELYLDLLVEADAHASRALSLSRAAGGGDPFRLYQILPRVWYLRGKLGLATELLDGAIEAGRLLGTPPALAGNLFNRSVVAVAEGHLDLALASAEEAVARTEGIDEGFVTAWAAVRLASALLELGRPSEAVEHLIRRAGGEELTSIPGGWRAYCLELLTRCWLALGRRVEASRAAAAADAQLARIPLPLVAAWAHRAVAAVALDAGDLAIAVERGRQSTRAADDAGAPIEAALSRVLTGRALAEVGERDEAIAELQRASAALDACGAVRFRQGADRELGKLGHRPHRRTSPGRKDAPGIEALTERELQVARLVVDRMTNPEIAAELFLSPKTVETHLSNIFNKMGVPTRVALARAIEHSDRFIKGNRADTD